MEHWRHHLWYFPLIAGTTWLTTLFVLLIYWLAAGRPRLPLQSNPYIAFISDIGAFHLKPFFIAGCTITAISYMGTLFSVHYARYSKHMYGITNDSRWRKIISMLALFSGLVACAGLLLLTIFDTYRYNTIHRKLLLICFAGLGSSMVTTSVVWLDQAVKPSPFVRLRKWCLANNAIVLAEIILGIAFVALMWQGILRAAGILEWTITITGGFYLLSFVGYLWKAWEQAPSKEEGERRPLLVNT